MSSQSGLIRLLAFFKANITGTEVIVRTAVAIANAAKVK